MNKLIATGLVFFSLSATSVEANWKDDIRGEYKPTKEKKETSLKPLSIGISTYTTIIRISLSNVDDIEFDGPAISMGYSFTDHIAINAAFFFLESDTNSALNTIQSDGYDLMLNFGTGLVKEGFIAFGGVGIFRDKLSSNTNAIGEYTFRSIQLGGGVGYRWDNVSLTANINLRKSSEYDELLDTYIIASSPGYTGSGDSGYGYVMSSAITLAMWF